MNTFAYQAQLADLGVSLAVNYANMAMSGAFAAAALAFTLPLALAASGYARPKTAAADALVAALAPAAQVVPYSAYRSDGGHATTLVLMGPMPTR